MANNGSATLAGWTVRLTLAGGQSLANVWTGVSPGTSAAVSVRYADYNGTLGVNASTTFGFLVNGGSDAPPGGPSCTSP
ncbi:cellulose binding domain-containing protein [Micromonospora sp. NPDC051300]|uniref:cellulose binding domain-containing protein n=1 Tax=Micromonospora sp. NPDC051300 TaxID=3364286 RepID=UPI0037AC377D